MANYIVNACFNNEEYVVTANTTFAGGEIISFTIGEDQPICGVVQEETEEIYTYIHLNTYSDCCECYTGNSYQSFVFNTCTPTDSVFVDITAFCASYGDTPVLGDVFVIQDLQEDLNFCATASEVSTEDPESRYEVEPGEGPYTSCEECSNSEPPRSANTEVLVCEICCDCGATGSTINQVTPPHPVWTDGYGTAVTQLNMIVLGGPNGLNN